MSGTEIVDGDNAGLVDNVTRAFINGQDAINKDSDDLDVGGEDGDFQKAIETAQEGRLFAEMMIDDLEQRLDKPGRDAVTKAFGDLILASSNGFDADALMQREIIRDILEEYAAKLEQ